jgi:hypothetical protein
VTVMRFWHKAGWQPHRVRSYTASPDPQFEAKAKDILAVERRTVEYVRDGTVSLFAALELPSRKVLRCCAPRHISAEFREFLDQAVGAHR